MELKDTEISHTEKQPKPKKIKDKDRLIARMILGIGLSLSIASAVACGISHPKFSDVKDEYWSIKDRKDAYLDTFEQSDEFKTAYNADVQSLNDRLIARAIDGDTYDKELEKLKDNTYTEKVLLATANEQTKAEFNEINQKYLDADKNWNKYALPFCLSSIFVVHFPLCTSFGHYLFKPTKKEKFEEQFLFKHHISPEAMKKVMEIPDIPYNAIGYHPINAEENQICKDILKNVTHNDDTPRNCGYPINAKDTQENEETLTK